jgi:XTP/dITP diphosphohydrolase
VSHARTVQDMKIVLATHNRDKVKEIEAIMAPVDVELVGPDAVEGMPEILEDGATLEENALKKARGIREFTGLCALADDTGLEVDALDGAPGVHSARYAGESGRYEDNNRKLLQELGGVPASERTARFRCVMALALNDDVAGLFYARMKERGASISRPEYQGSKMTDALVTEGILVGRIALANRGEAGFGYDPLFEIPKLGKTLAELGLETKNEMSHRYRALIEMRGLLIRWKLATKRKAAEDM